MKEYGYQRVDLEINSEGVQIYSLLKKGGKEVSIDAGKYDSLNLAKKGKLLRKRIMAGTRYSAITGMYADAVAATYVLLDHFMSNPNPDPSIRNIIGLGMVQLALYFSRSFASMEETLADQQHDLITKVLETRPEYSTSRIYPLTRSWRNV